MCVQSMCMVCTIVHNFVISVLMDVDFERRRRDSGLRLGPVIGSAFLTQLRKDVELLMVQGLDSCCFPCHVCQPSVLAVPLLRATVSWTTRCWLVCESCQRKS